jgi:hypothetical protein
MKVLLLVLPVVVFPVQAEVFKCTINPYKIIYQATPCASDNTEQKVDTKPRSAEQEAAAALALKEWQAKYSAQQAAEKAALKAEKNKQPRNIIIQVVERPLPQLRMRKFGKRRMRNLP